LENRVWDEPLFGAQFSQHVPAGALPLGLVLIGVVFDWLRSVTANALQIIVQKIDGEPQVVEVHAAVKG